MKKIFISFLLLICVWLEYFKGTEYKFLNATMIWLVMCVVYLIVPMIIMLISSLVKNNRSDKLIVTVRSERAHV